MIQMTFKMAKIMAPSIIYIDEVEKVRAIIVELTEILCRIQVIGKCL